eukprot:gene4428-5437_t
MEDPAKPELLSDDKGLYAVIRKIQELKKHAYHGPDHGHAVLVAVAGPSGVGKTYFVKRIAGIIPSVCISLDQYVNTNSEQSKSADDPTNFDYDLLFQNLSGLKYGQDVWAPRYNFKTNQRDGFYKILSKNSKVVVVEGTFVLNERVRHLFDLRVGVSGGVHSDLVKRIMRDTQTTSAMRDKLARVMAQLVRVMAQLARVMAQLARVMAQLARPLTRFTTSDASKRTGSRISVPTKEVEAYLATIGDGKWDHHASIETGDIYLLPPGEDQETCRNWIRMRLRHGSYSLVFEEYISDGPMLISPSMSFEVSLQVLQGLMTLGYVVGATIKRVSHVYVTSKAVSSSSKRLSIKYDDIGVLGRSFIQIESKDRLAVEEAGRALQMEGTFVPQSYIELVPTLSPDVIEPCSEAGREFDALIMEHPVANTPANQAYLNQVERLNQMEHEGQLADNAASKLVMLAQTDHSVTYSPTTQSQNPSELLMQQIAVLNEAQMAMTTQLAALHSLSSHKRGESRGLGDMNAQSYEGEAEEG